MITAEEWKQQLDSLPANFHREDLQDLVRQAPVDAPVADLEFARGYLAALELSDVRNENPGDFPLVIFTGEIQVIGPILRGIDALCAANRVKVFVNGQLVFPTPSDDDVARRLNL